MIPTYTRGSARLAAGLVIVLGALGSADHSPLTLQSVLVAALGLLLAGWGIRRQQHGPLLRQRVRQGRVTRQIRGVEA